MVEDAQAEVAEVKRKEERQRKFQYASITFDTFKPTEKCTPSVYQPEPDCEHQEHGRLSSFRMSDYNPSADRVELARSYEIVSLIPIADQARKKDEWRDAGGQEEYHKLTRQGSKMKGYTQRNFSISNTNHPASKDYAQLQMQMKPPPREEEIKLPPRTTLQGEEIKPPPHALQEEVATNKPPIMKRSFVQKEQRTMNKFPSYSEVQKARGPPLPPRSDPIIMVDNGGGMEEEHYKVPSVRRSIHDTGMEQGMDADAQGHYDHPSSLVRVAWSCENLKKKNSSQEGGTSKTIVVGGTIYDSPSSTLMVRSQSSMMQNGMQAPSQSNLSERTISQDSYIEMTGSQVSYERQNYS